MEARSEELPPSKKLTGDNIVGIDLNGLSLYAVISHQKYTLGHFILGYIDINEYLSKQALQ